MNHSVFSPSAAHRVLRCPPSLRLNELEEDKGSVFAMEGTCAHELCAYLVEKGLGREVQDPTESLDYYNQEMQECAESYAAFVLEKYEQAKQTCPDTQVFIEQRVDISRWVPECGGTADCIILSDGTAHVIDYKQGLGVLVEASSEDFGGNPQLMCYCLGVLDMFDTIYDIDTVKMTIFQPRKENVSEYTMKKEDLLKWAEEVLRPTAALALKGEGEFSAGEHCRFCKVKANCRKRAEYNLQVARYDFKMPEFLTDTEVDSILLLTEHLTEWANDVREYALTEAMLGKDYERFKLVAGRSNRKYMTSAQKTMIFLTEGTK